MKRLIRMRASNLKVLITSATLDGEKMSRFFSNCPILNVPGKLFPVEIFYNMECPKSYLESSLKTAIGMIKTVFLLCFGFLIFVDFVVWCFLVQYNLVLAFALQDMILF
ncbi:hypothetical protein CsSME_00017860 [Camellia sinensis var. sinensis]